MNKQINDHVNDQVWNYVIWAYKLAPKLQFTFFWTHPVSLKLPPSPHTQF